MNDQLARSLFMDYLYDEMDEQKKQQLEQFLEKNPHLQHELDEFRQTRLNLQKFSVESPGERLLFLEPNRSGFYTWWRDARRLFPRSVWGRAGFVTATVMMLLFFIISAASVHIESSAGGVAVTFGYTPVTNRGMTEEQAQQFIEQFREEQSVLLAEYIETLNRQNRDHLEQLVQHFQQQRINDLQLVNHTLNELQQQTDYRLQQTNQFLGQVLQTVSLAE